MLATLLWLVSSGAVSQPWLHNCNHLGNTHIFKNMVAQFSLVDNLIQIEIYSGIGNIFTLIRWFQSAARAENCWARKLRIYGRVGGRGYFRLADVTSKWRAVWAFNLWGGAGVLLNPCWGSKNTWWCTLYWHFMNELWCAGKCSTTRSSGGKQNPDL